MKNMMKYWMFVAVAAMGMISCSEDKSESNIPAPELPMVTMTVTAEDVEADDSRTYYDEAAGKARWESTGEKICVWESIDAAAATKAESAEAVVTDGKAKFTVQFTEAAGAEFAYNAVYPSSAVVENNNLVVSKLKLITPAVQTSTATSFDGAADLLIAQPKSFEAQPTELSLAFKRVVAVGKMTLKNIATEDAILSVTFSSTDKVLAGRSYFDATTGEVVEYGYDSASDLLTINFEGGLTNLKEGTPIFFTALPCAIAGGESFTVTVSTAKQKFTRTVTLPEGAQPIAFNAGRISSFSVNMASATVSEITSLEGEYAVMALAGGNLQLMGDQETDKTYLKRVQKDAATEIPASIDVTDDESLIWIVEPAATEGQYYLKQKSSGNYVAWTSGNVAVLQEAAYALTIAKQDDGSYNVTSVAATDRNLRYNASSPRFAFYTSAQTPIYLVPVKVSTDPKLQVNAQPETVAAEGADVEVALTTANLTEEIEATVTYTDGESWIGSVAVAADKLTFTVAENTTEEERTATITLSANGVEDTVTVKQSGKAAEGEEVAYYEKVTSSLTDYSGTYLIVYETGKVAFDGSLATLDAESNTKSVTITDNKIEATAEMDAIAFTISGTQDNYTLQSASGNYIGVSSNNNGLKQTTTATTYKHNISIDATNGALIKAVFSGSTMALRYNSTSGQTRFRYYKNTGQQSIALYKKVGGTGGDETPEEPTQLAAPTDVTATAVGKTVSVTWSEVTNATSYTVTCTEDSQTQTVTTTTAEFELADYSTSYTFSVVANGDGTNYADSSAATATVTTEANPNTGSGEDSGELMTASISFSSYSGSMTDGTIVNLDSNITATFAKGGGTSNPAWNGGYVRLYQKSGGGDGGTMTIACPSGMTITKIELTYSGSHNYFKVDTGTLSTDKKTWEGSASAVKFTVNGTSSSQRAYVGSIKVTYQ